RLDRRAVELEEQVAGPEAATGRRAPRHDVDHVDGGAAPEALAEGGRQRTAAAGDAEGGPTESTVTHERGDDAGRRRVDRHREAEPDPRDRGVDPDDVAGAVGEGAAGV